MVSCADLECGSRRPPPKRQIPVASEANRFLSHSSWPRLWPWQPLGGTTGRATLSRSREAPAMGSVTQPRIQTLLEFRWMSLQVPRLRGGLLEDPEKEEKLSACMDHLCPNAVWKKDAEIKRGQTAERKASSQRV